MSTAQTIREIFRQAARSSLSLVASAERVYDPLTGTERVVITRPAVPATRLLFTNERLPDARRESARQRMQRTGERRLHPTVYIDAKVSVALDDLAKEGLVRTMRSRGMTRQEAARYLIAHARPQQKQ